jgi:hypothetical protein
MEEAVLELALVPGAVRILLHPQTVLPACRERPRQYAQNLRARLYNIPLAEVSDALVLRVRLVLID